MTENFLMDDFGYCVPVSYTHLDLLGAVLLLVEGSQEAATKDVFQVHALDAEDGLQVLERDRRCRLLAVTEKVHR